MAAGLTVGVALVENPGMPGASQLYVKPAPVGEAPSTIEAAVQTLSSNPAFAIMPGAIVTVVVAGAPMHPAKEGVTV